MEISHIWRDTQGKYPIYGVIQLRKLQCLDGITPRKSKQTLQELSL